MARIPEAEIERLKNEVAVQRLVEGSGIELKKGGKDWLGRCPFHEDETASLVVSPGKNLWHCFGCGIGGGPIDWVMKREGVSFRHAVELLRGAHADSSSSAAGSTAEAAAVRVARLSAPMTLDAGEQELLDQVMGYYHETLLQSPQALAYLDKRGIADRELIERHRLGYANRTLGYRLPATRIKAGAELRGRLQKIGVPGCPPRHARPELRVRTRLRWRCERGRAAPGRPDRCGAAGCNYVQEFAGVGGPVRGPIAGSWRPHRGWFAG